MKEAELENNIIFMYIFMCVYGCVCCRGKCSEHKMCPALLPHVYGAHAISRNSQLCQVSSVKTSSDDAIRIENEIENIGKKG
jgi:hypothetical protein